MFDCLQINAICLPNQEIRYHFVAPDKITHHIPSNNTDVTLARSLFIRRLFACLFIMYIIFVTMSMLFHLFYIFFAFNKKCFVIGPIGRLNKQMKQIDNELRIDDCTEDTKCNRNNHHFLISLTFFFLSLFFCVLILFAGSTFFMPLF